MEARHHNDAVSDYPVEDAVWEASYKDTPGAAVNDRVPTRVLEYLLERLVNDVEEFVT